MFDLVQTKTDEQAEEATAEAESVEAEAPPQDNEEVKKLMTDLEKKEEQLKDMKDRLYRMAAGVPI